MFLILAFLFLVIPIVELYVIVQVAGSVGVFETIGLLIAVSIVGAWLVRREGTSVMRKMQQQLGQGEMPTKQLADGGLILFAGALMLTPGFVTDALGVLLLIPPSRAAIRTVVMRQFRHRVQRVVPFTSMGFGSPVTDVHGTESAPGSREAVDLTREDQPHDKPHDPPSRSS